jgi:hypothetical protein
MGHHRKKKDPAGYEDPSVVAQVFYSLIGFLVDALRLSTLRLRQHSTVNHCLIHLRAISGATLANTSGFWWMRCAYPPYGPSSIPP